MSRPLRWLAAAAVVVLAALLLHRALVTAAQTVPQLEYTVLDGSKHTTAQWRGRVVLVVFWATTCAVCVQEMPHLVDTYARFHPRGLDLLAVAMSHDPPARVVEFAHSRQLPFPVAIDLQGRLAHGFARTQATPTAFVLDRDGRIAQRYEGRFDPAHLHALVERLLSRA